MARPTLEERLEHMLEAIIQIETHTANVDEAAFAADRFRRFGIERCLEIISEASRHIPVDHTANHTEIPWRRLADIGNRIRHSYHAVDSGIVWAIVTNELPALKAALRAITEAARPPSKEPK